MSSILTSLFNWLVSTLSKSTSTTVSSSTSTTSTKVSLPVPTDPISAGLTLASGVLSEVAIIQAEKNTPTQINAKEVREEANFAKTIEQKADEAINNNNISKL